MAQLTISFMALTADTLTELRTIPVSPLKPVKRASKLGSRFHQIHETGFVFDSY